MNDNTKSLCTHHIHINTLAPGEHIIGTCSKCGRQVDYTILQEQDKGFRQICLTNTLTRPGVDMSSIMKSRNGNGKKPKRKPRLSRGRVR